MNPLLFPPEMPSGIGRVKAVCWVGGIAVHTSTADAFCGIDATPIASMQATSAAPFVIYVIDSPRYSPSFPALNLRPGRSRALTARFAPETRVQLAKAH